ncbi:MAG: hypothetical protein Q9167_002364 [Letrouitia subvulpina]
MTVVTSPSDLIYEAVSGPLKRVVSDSSSIPSKAAAIHTLGICTFFGGASDDEILDNMAYFLEVIASDGAFIEAQDEAGPVVAALEEWGALSTLIEDISDDSEDAAEYFVEQLSSTDPTVQIAAGENIALLYEKSYRPLTEDDSIGDYKEFDIISDPDNVSGVPKMVKVYDPYRRTDTLKDTLSNLASLNSRRLSKKDQKSLRTNFTDILNSVEYPTHGPRYQNAINHETGKRFGSRMTVRIHREGVMRIDKWWKLHRLQGLRRVLQGGFVTHYEKNPVIFESKNASSEFEEVSHEVVALHAPIKELEDEARNPNSVLSRAGSSKCKELSELLQNCKLVLNRLDTLLVKYRRLGTQSRRTWDRLKFGCEGLQDVREKLTFHTSTINLFLTSLGTGSLGRIERKLDEIIGEIKAGKREPTLLSVSDEEDPTEAERQWDALKGELLEEGLSKPEVEAHKLTIRAKIQAAIDSTETHDAGRQSKLPTPPIPFRHWVPPRSPSPVYFHHRVPPRELVPLKRRASEISEYHEETTEYDGSGQIKKHTVVRRSSTPRTVQSSPIYTSPGGFNYSITPPLAITPPLRTRDSRNWGISDPLASAASHSNITAATPLGASTPTQAQHGMTTLKTESGPVLIPIDPRPSSSFLASSQHSSTACVEERKGYTSPSRSSRNKRVTLMLSLRRTIKKLKEEREQLRTCYRKAWQRGDFYRHERNRYRAMVGNDDTSLSAPRTPVWQTCLDRPIRSPVPVSPPKTPAWINRPSDQETLS